MCLGTKVYTVGWDGSKPVVYKRESVQCRSNSKKNTRYTKTNDRFTREIMKKFLIAEHEYSDEELKEANVSNVFTICFQNDNLSMFHVFLYLDGTQSIQYITEEKCIQIQNTAKVLLKTSNIVFYTEETNEEVQISI